MTTVQDTIEDQIENARPSQRPPATYASTLTSVDTKLVYNHDRDRFEAFIIGDINATPEGIAPMSDGQEGVTEGVGNVYDGKSLADLVADGYLWNARQHTEADLDVARIHHPETRENGGWAEEDYLVQDKKRIADAIERHSDVGAVYDVVPDGDLRTDDGRVYVNGDEVNGYVNLYDRGQNLLNAFAGEDGVDLYAQAKGANAATAVWNTDETVRPWTDKNGLLDVAEEITGSLETVHTVDHEAVDTLAEVVDANLDSQVIVKGALGTWGDTVVPLSEGVDYDRARIEIRAWERRVRDRGNRPDDFRIIDDDDRFVLSSVGSSSIDAYDAGVANGVVEEAVTGRIRREGDTYEVFEYPPGGPAGERRPVDFVAIAAYNPATRQPEVPAIHVRSSGEYHPNANCGGKNFTAQTLDEAFTRGVKAPGYGEIEYNLGEQLGELAGRDVTIDEVREPLETAGLAAFGTRNVAAFRAEEALAD